jgi:hypothetical protein
LAFVLLPLEARAQCGGGRAQMRTMMSASPQSSPRGGSTQEYALLSLLQQQSVLRAVLQQQQQNALQAAVQAPAQNAVKPVLKQQNAVQQQNAGQQQELQLLVQESRQLQLAQLEALKQRANGGPAQRDPASAPDR